MPRKVWTPAEFERLSPAEQDDVFANSIVRDLAEVPLDFLERVRDRVRARIDGADADSG
jgi:hypothetical protein